MASGGYTTVNTLASNVTGIRHRPRPERKGLLLGQCRRQRDETGLHGLARLGLSRHGPRLDQPHARL